jgi:hypothetical protein
VHGAAVPYARSPAHHATAASSPRGPRTGHVPPLPRCSSRAGAWRARRRGETGHRVSEKNGLSPKLLEIASAGADVLSSELPSSRSAPGAKKKTVFACPSYLALSKVSWKS